MIKPGSRPMKPLKNLAGQKVPAGLSRRDGQGQVYIKYLSCPVRCPGGRLVP